MEKYSYLLGFIPAKMFLAMIGFACIGIIVALLIDATKRNHASPSTPVKFSWKFLIVDNLKTILLTALAILITLRFVSSVFPGQFIDTDLASPIGMEKWLFGSFLIGLAYNTLLQTLKQKSELLQAKRD